MDYKRRDNYYIIDIIKKAIKTLNVKKGTKLRLLNATFDVGVDDKHGTEWHLDKTITASIEDTTDNKPMKLFWYESFFDPDLPDDEDEISGASRISDPEGKILLRVAYGIWSGRRWISELRKKKLII